jgi:hypothetical protein
MRRAGLLTVLLLLSAPARATTLSLSLPPPLLAGPCTAAQVGQALQARRPDLQVQAAPSAGAVAVELTIEGGAWVLHVSSPPAPPLRRELPPPGADCEELSQTAALMVARYLEEIRAAGEPVAIQPIVHEPPPPPVPLQAWVGLGAGATTGPTVAGPVFHLELAGRRGPNQLALAGTLGLPSQVGIASVGHFAIEEGRVEIVGERRLSLGPGDVPLGVVVGAELTRVSAQASGTDELVHPKPTTAFSPVVGLRAGYELFLPLGLALGLRAEGGLLLQPNNFSIESYPGATTVQSARFDGALSLLLSRTFF